MGGWNGGTGVSPGRRQADRFLILKKNRAFQYFRCGKFGRGGVRVGSGWHFYTRVASIL